jgi:hypothetical protein
MSHSADNDTPEEGQGMRCDARYGKNPDLCYLQFNHRGAHSNRWGTTWVTATYKSSRVIPPEVGHA